MSFGLSSRRPSDYALRDPAVHQELVHRETVSHPSGKTNVGKETTDYCVENVRAALDLAFDVVLTAMRSRTSPLP